MSNTKSEDYEQASFVSFVRTNYPETIVFSVPNGGARDIKTAAIMRLTGTLAGVPDLILIDEGKILFIEMKRTKNGKVSDKQAQVHEKIRQNGFRVEVCNGYFEAKRVFFEFFNKKT